MKLDHQSVDISTDPDKFFSQMGKFATLIATTPAFAKVPMDVGLSMVQSALLNKSYCMYADDTGKPVAGLLWAFINEEEKEYYLRYGMLRGAKAWNSGDQLWFLNIVAHGGLFKMIFEDMKEELFKNHTEGFMLRPSRSGKRRVVRLTHNSARVIQTLPAAKKQDGS